MLGEGGDPGIGELVVHEQVEAGPGLVDRPGHRAQRGGGGIAAVADDLVEDEADDRAGSGSDRRADAGAGGIEHDRRRRRGPDERERDRRGEGRRDAQGQAGVVDRRGRRDEGPDLAGGRDREPG